MLKPIERLCCRLAGVDSSREQDWKSYSLALLAFTLISLLRLFAILMLQGSLPLNQQQLPGLEWTLAFNIAVIFADRRGIEVSLTRKEYAVLGQLALHIG